MSTPLLEREIAERTLARAMSRGGDFAEVFCEDSSSRSARLDQGRVDELSSGRDRGAGIRVIVGTTTGFAYTADLSETSLLAAADAAAAVARGGTSKTVALGGFTGYSTAATRDPAQVDTADKIALLRQADDVARSENGAIHEVQVVVADSSRRFVVANSDGVFAGDHQIRTRFAIQCVATGDAGMQTGSMGLGATRGFELLNESDVTATARSAAAMAITKLSAVPAPSGNLPVVIERGSGGVLFHEACGHGLEADHVAKSSSVFAGRLGERVASPLVTIVDDGSIEGQWGFGSIDDEGHASGRHVLIENGILTDYMWDHLRASREGRTGIANGRRENYMALPMVRMTNTFLLAGEESADDIIASTPHGIYVAKLGGGQVNMATGDFVFGTRLAFLIEDGRITAPLRECQLIGNGPEILSRVDAVANDFAYGDPGTCGKDGQSVPVGVGQATLRLSSMTIGGSAA